MRATATLLGSQIGDYELVDFLGAGGMGEVYRAVHVRLDRTVAVKVLHKTSSNAKFVERFRNEARIQASLRHPNIVTLYDFVEHTGRLCIIMEYVDGQSLDAVINQAGRMEVDEALAIFGKVVEALDYTHRQGVVHRDIKPHNIKISRRGEVKVLDFGIAKTETSPGLTATGAVVGTPEYLSPEQLRGKPADARTDVWALGVLLYEMLTGRIPFEAPSLIELYKKIDQAQFARPSALASGVPKDLEAIVMRCLQRRPSSRYQTAGELLRDVRQCAPTRVPGDRRPAFRVSLARLKQYIPTLPARPAVVQAVRRHGPFYFLGLASLLLALVVFLGPQLRSPTSGLPDVPSLVQPGHQATGISLDPTLVWGAASGATQFHLQLATVPNFSTLVLERGDLAGTTLRIRGLKGAMTYYVRLRAVNARGASDWSAVHRFETAGRPAADPERRAITIDVFGGKAEVWRRNTRLGTTPYRLDVRVGEHVELILKRDRYHDKVLNFDVTAVTTGFTESMVPK